MDVNRYRIASRAAGQPLIAADVGGTHARVASIVPVADERGSAFAIGDYCKYACADFPSLAAIVESFRASYVRTPVSSAALAIAGFVVDDAVVNVNLPWPVSISDLRTRLGLDDLAVVNDFKAVAYAVGHVDDASALLLGGPAEHRPGPMLVVGPGTGLGGAVHIAQDGRPVILATEVGQATLAATTELEFDVLRELRKRSPRLNMDGEMQGDTAWDEILRGKIMPNSTLKGRANLFVMPNLEAANIAYNLVRVFTDGVAIGPILMGISKPVHILTTSATPRRILNMTAIAAVDAQIRQQMEEGRGG